MNTAAIAAALRGYMTYRPQDPLMFKIRDPIAIKRIEREIGRKLTPTELEQVDAGEELILEKPNGELLVEEIDVLGIRDLMRVESEYEEAILRENRKLIREARKEARRYKNKKHPPNQVLEQMDEPSQVFTHEPANEEYFSALEKAVSEISHLFKHPDFKPRYAYLFKKTNWKILELHIEGRNDSEISNWLKSKDNRNNFRCEVLSEDAVGDRLRKCFHILGITPRFHRSYLEVSKSKTAKKEIQEMAETEERIRRAREQNQGGAIIRRSKVITGGSLS